MHRLPILLAAFTVTAAADPWPSQYHIKPWENERLTAADVVGPDGIVYPDWRRAGVTGGIPDFSKPDVSSQSREFLVPTGADDTAVAKVLAEALALAKGGGKSLVRFAAGTYRLSAALPKIDAPNVVITGAGMDKTILEILSGGKGRALFDTGPKSSWGPETLVLKGMIPRGATRINASAIKGFAVNDIIWLGPVLPSGLPPDAIMRKRYDWPESKTFYTNPYNGHFGRGMLASVAAVDETSITLDRPVSHDLYADESVQLRKTGLVSGIGIQDLTITSAPGAKIDPICWENIADSWLLRVAIRKPSDWPVTGSFRLNCEIRNCVFDGTQAEINNGSTAYLGWSGVMTDCLMVGAKANDLRHMAIFQGAIRCVVRDCVFTGKTVRSPQFHGQLPHDNLIEGTTFDVKSEVWTVDGMATLRHGVEGPRNVLYHCLFPGSQGSAVFNGGVEGHILAYNQWRMGDNEAWRASPILAFDRTWNTIIRGNVIQADTRYPFANLNDRSCTGWEIRGNTIHGSNGIVAQGDGAVALNDHNRVLPLDVPMTEPRPEAASIIDWQRAHGDKPRLVAVPCTQSVLAPGTMATLRVSRIKPDTAGELVMKIHASPDGLVTLPESATIPAGKIFADVTVSHRGVKTGEVTITAEADGHLADSERFTILGTAPNPAEWLQADGDHRAEGLPAGWQLTDFDRSSSSLAPATSAKFADDTITLTGGGIAFNTDRNIRVKSRGQLWQIVDGDTRITAKLDSTSSEAQTGLIIADDAAPITECTALLADGTVLSSGANHEYTAEILPLRKGDGDRAPVWLRLERKGGIFTAWRATAENPTEADWTQLAQVDVYADPPKGQEHYRSQAKWDQRIHVGILLNSFKSGTPATATWSRISLIPLHSK